MKLSHKKFYYLNTLILKLIKIRYPKFLINAFATLGLLSFVFLANENNPPIQNSIGKYQISSFGYVNTANSRTEVLAVLNTETGVIKTYDNPSSNIGD